MNYNENSASCTIMKDSKVRVQVTLLAPPPSSTTAHRPLPQLSLADVVAENNEDSDDEVEDENSESESSGGNSQGLSENELASSGDIDREAAEGNKAGGENKKQNTVGATKFGPGSLNDNDA